MSAAAPSLSPAAVLVVVVTANRSQQRLQPVFCALHRLSLLDVRRRRVTVKSLSIDAVFATAVVPSTDDDTPAWSSLFLGIRHETTRTHRQRERAQVANLTHSPESRSPLDPTDRQDTLAHRQQGT